MMPLPALDEAERAYLRAPQSDAAVEVFAARLRQRLVASLGVPASVSASECGGLDQSGSRAEPAIAIAPELAEAWLASRFGGRPGAVWVARMDEERLRPFTAAIRRALAESVVNAGAADWPHRMRLDVSLGGRHGRVEIFWDGAHAKDWARRALREKA